MLTKSAVFSLITCRSTDLIDTMYMYSCRSIGWPQGVVLGFKMSMLCGNENFALQYSLQMSATSILPGV